MIYPGHELFGIDPISRIHYEPVSATLITIGVIAAAVGGATLGGIAAGQQHQQAIDAAEHDVEMNELIQEQTEGLAGAEQTQARERRTRATERLTAERETAMVDIGNQERQATLAAANERENILVATENAVGVREAQIAASGLRGTQGSSMITLGQTEAAGNIELERNQERLEESSILADAGRDRVESTFTEAVADLELDTEQTIYDIEIREQQAIAQLDADLTWMNDQLDWATGAGGWTSAIGGGIISGASSGLSLAGSITSFF